MHLNRLLILFIFNSALFSSHTLFAKTPTITNSNIGGSAQASTGVSIADLNNDGKNDAVLFSIGRHWGGQAMICHYQANQKPIFKCDQAIGYQNAPGVAISTGNFDDDSLQDIVLAYGDCHNLNPKCKQQPAVVILYGKENYQKIHSLTTRLGRARALTVADIDNNGLDDIVVGSIDADNLLFLAKAPGKFDTIPFKSLGQGTLGLAVYKNSAKQPFIVTTTRYYPNHSNGSIQHENAVYRYDAASKQLIQLDTFGKNLQSVGAVIGNLDKTPQQYS